MPTSEPKVTAESFHKAFADDLDKERRARKLHAQTTVVLSYCNIPLSPTADGFDTASILGNGGGFCQQTLSRLLLGGVKVLVWSPGLPSWQSDNLGIAGREKVGFILGQIQAVHDLAEQTDGLLEVARTTADIRRINSRGGVAILLHLSGANHLNDMGVLREYYDMGVRIIHAGYQDWPDDGGTARTVQFENDPQDRIYHAGKLNEHGRRTLEEMKRLGIIVDVAHIRPEGFDDVAQIMEGVPYIYSHGACATLAPGWWRNLDDERISKIASNGGVYGIVPTFGPRA